MKIWILLKIEQDEPSVVLGAYLKESDATEEADRLNSNLPYIGYEVEKTTLPPMYVLVDPENYPTGPFASRQEAEVYVKQNHGITLEELEASGDGEFMEVTK